MNAPDDSYTYDLVNDENGRLVQAFYYGNGTGEGKASDKYEYEYDEYGNQTAVQYDSYSTRSDTWLPGYSIYYEYGIDEKGNVQWMSESSSDRTTEYTYNSQGLLETEVTSGTDYSQTIHYTYDDHGNMIVDHCVTVSDGERTESINSHTYELIELFPSEMEEEE